MRSEFFWYPGIEATRIQFTKGQRWKRATDRGHLQGIEVSNQETKQNDIEIDIGKLYTLRISSPRRQNMSKPRRELYMTS